MTDQTNPSADDTPESAESPRNKVMENLAGDHGGHQIAFNPLAQANRQLSKLIPPGTEESAGQAFGGRTRRTIENYDLRVRGLYRAASKARTQDPQYPYEPSPVEVVDDLIQSLTSENPRTTAGWRVARAALLYHLAAHREKHPAYAEAYTKLANTRYPTATLRAPTTKAKKTSERRALSLADLSRVLQGLGSMNSTRTDVGSYTQIWLQAGLACGARIVEWPGVHWADRAKYLLTIPNSKLKAGKPAFFRLKDSVANGMSVHDLPEEDGEDYSASKAKTRTIRVAPSDAIYVDLHLSFMWRAIHASMAAGCSQEVAFDRYYHRCRKALRDASLKVLKRSVTLRVGRSQFAANKKAEFGLGAAAAMMGHSGSSTTRDYYAPRRAAHSGSRAERDASGQQAEQADHDAQSDSPAAPDSDTPPIGVF